MRDIIEAFNPVVVFGSARSDGNTKKAISAVFNSQEVPLIDLNNYQIADFCYNTSNEDDFIPIVKEMLKFNPIILASPIYWYTVSAVMKRFLDRWAELLYPSYKHLKESFQNKTVYSITSYASLSCNISEFEIVLKNSSLYMGMLYGGCYAYYAGSNDTLIKKNATAAQVFKNNMCILKAKIVMD